MYLTDRASLLRALFRLLDTDLEAGDMTEHDPADVHQEGILLQLQQGAEDAQAYMLKAGSTWWLETSEPLDFQPQSDGRLAVTLPEGFRRLYGDGERSALHDARGTRWGVEIEPDLQWDGTRNGYFLSGDKLRLVSNASPPAGLMMDYVRRIAEIRDGTDVDFPEDDRSLIVAFAAFHAREESWYTGGPAGDRKIERNLGSKKSQAWTRARRTSTPRRARTPRVPPHWPF